MSPIETDKRARNIMPSVKPNMLGNIKRDKRTKVEHLQQMALTHSPHLTSIYSTLLTIWTVSIIYVGTLITPFLTSYTWPTVCIVVSIIACQPSPSTL